MQDFRRLAVWARAHAFALNVRRAVRTFPRSGYAELRSQLTAAAESIAHNIVEGCGASSRKEFARFLEVSIKSTSEAEYQIQLAHDYGILPVGVWESLTRKVVEIRRMLCGLRRTVLDAGERDERSRRVGNNQRRNRR
jgi:four helix bundle protein